MDIFCKCIGCFLFKLAFVIEGCSITSLCHTALVPSVVFSFVPVSLVGMVLSRSPVAVCVRSEIARIEKCKYAAIWAIETPSLNIVKESVFSFI